MALRRTYPQCGQRTSEHVRQVLLAAALRFVRHARELPGVPGIALIGSLATNKRFPKDVDVLVTISGEMQLFELARAGRQLAGAAQQINGGADVFLADPAGEYLTIVRSVSDRRVPAFAAPAAEFSAAPRSNTWTAIAPRARTQ